MKDLAQTVKFILNHKEFNVDANGYAVIGFSAGAHLAASFGTKSLGYEQYGLNHVEDQKLHEQYSIEKQVDISYPPVYLWQCEADETVPIENSSMLVKKLEQNKVPYKYEVFPGKEHGWGLGTGTDADGWVERAIDFWKRDKNSRK